jgi:hypothetical protein
MTALIQGREDNEPMAPNLVTSIECHEKCSDSRSVVGNLSQYPIQFGTFSFDEKYCKEYDKLSCDLMDMWTRPSSTRIGLQSHPNCQNYIGESTHKSNSEFSSSPVRNPGADHMKTDVQVAYDIQSGRSLTLWKDKEIIFPMGLVSYPTKI